MNMLIQNITFKKTVSASAVTSVLLAARAIAAVGVRSKLTQPQTDPNFRLDEQDDARATDRAMVVTAGDVLSTMSR